MKDKVNIKVDLTQVAGLKKYDSPISFICGKEMIEKVGIIIPESGVVIYLFHESEIKEHGMDWLPEIPPSYHIAAYCLPDVFTYDKFIIKSLNGLSDVGTSWDFKTLQGIDLK